MELTITMGLQLTIPICCMYEDIWIPTLGEILDVEWTLYNTDDYQFTVDSDSMYSTIVDHMT